MLTKDEAERNGGLETLRADYSVRGDEVIQYRAVSEVFVQMGEALNAIQDPAELHVRLLDSAFEIIPALRGAILLNGARVSPDPKDFISQIYRERGFDGQLRFGLSTRVLESLYSEPRVFMSNDVTPVMCAPLIVSGAMRGVIYFEGREGKRVFEAEHLHYLKGIAAFAASAVRDAGKFESIVDARDLYKEERQTNYEIIGKSEVIRAVGESMRRVARADAAVLIISETGTGKELVAHGIHEMSGRRENPFVAINCGGIVETLLQSELFGHAKGAFTGAVDARKGKLKQADGGTVFLDEIAELTMMMQSSLLRVLQYQEFDPLGKDQPVKVDVRVIAATNVDLEEAVLQKKFRQDLLFRLNVVVILVPPLRERPEDIPLLAAHFLRKYAKIRPVSGIAPEAMAAMMSYPWPGNVRELENVIQAAIINGDSEIVRLEDLPKRVTERKSAATPDASFRKKGQAASRAAQRAEVERLMKENGWDVATTAQFLEVSAAYVYRLLKDKP